MTVSQLDPTARRSPSSIARDRAFIDEFAYTGPGTLMGRYMRLFWQPVARSIDLPAGKAKPITVMNERFTLYRGESGTAYVVDHHCPHRGTQLSVGWVQGEEIRCLYHGWKFAGDGACVERPGERGKSGAGIRIGAYPTREFFGLIYVYFGEGEPPAFPPFPDFGGEGVVENYATMLPVNFFQSWENDWDPYHARWTHQTGELHEIDYDLALETEKNEELDYGVRRTMEIGGGAINTAILMFPATVQLLIPTFNGYNKRSAGPSFRRTYLTHVPIDDHSHWAYISQLVPVSADEVESYAREYEAQEALNRTLPRPADIAGPILRNGITTIEDVRDHPMLVEIEDSLAQGGQGTIADRHAEHLGRTDAGVVMLRRIMARELQALAEGRPTKQWTTCPIIPLEGAYGQTA
ncbi:Rieske 2Fe-2S domain-containing protein [Flavisphingomonas formosensis]|uniref:Rieske 2Fe-2S domain-containing protein n=1 Tax=Flavisphingomonas formosensis TaxID=861534 RepID=UPI0012F7EE0F|nr:Rieske 2Fe-2S domain-containing protein [Sphingomonas formosensis]